MDTVLLDDVEAFCEDIERRVHHQGLEAKDLERVEKVLHQHPTEARLLSLASLAALLENKPYKTLSYQKRLRNHYVPNFKDFLFEAVAEALLGHWANAIKIRKAQNIDFFMPLHGSQFGKAHPWFRERLKEIDHKEKATLSFPKKSKTVAKTKAPPALPKKRDETQTSSPSPVSYPALTKVIAKIPIQFEFQIDKIWKEEGIPKEGAEWFSIRQQFAHLSLLQGFNELLCLSSLNQVETYWYQQETVRKVLKQFRGRVLLADEVGLGKTIEAGIVLKEYMLRGMVKKVLILTPASLVGQWQEEMSTKFGILFETSYSTLLKRDPNAFWFQPLVIASIALARRTEHLEILNHSFYDLIIVDEAHHLKNRTTKNWKLVDGLKKRFLLLLSATPVQNSLIELYNLLTLLKPGIFKTESEFRNQYMVPGKPRIPANPERLRTLMREVMIRNTRSLVDVRLPPRYAKTFILEPSPLEALCYKTLSDQIRACFAESTPQQKLSFHHLLSAAGSSPSALLAALHRFSKKLEDPSSWQSILQDCQTLSLGIKEKKLIELLQKNVSEKKIIFVHHRETLSRLGQILNENAMSFVQFDGSMSGPEKDLSIERFRQDIPILLCTETGGEGRNIQFCNTLINFDLPWNPMAIEQRIGRIHRIGQSREVFIFNLAVKNTVEEQVLRVLDEKINMFQLVIGEMNIILGEMDDSQDFENIVFDLWVRSTDETYEQHFETLGKRLSKAKFEYEAAKSLDEALFGEEFETT